MEYKLEEFKKDIFNSRIIKFKNMAEMYNYLEESMEKNHDERFLWETLGAIETIFGIIEVYERDGKIHKGYLQEKINRINILINQLKNIEGEE